MARSMSTRGNPILSIFAIAASRWAPRVKADGSFQLPSSVVAPAAGAAGVGVPGANAVEVEAGAGAEGAAGVFVT